MKIYIVGYMGAGKSNFGADLALQLGFNFIDLDDVFQEKYHISVGDFFVKYGEEPFRKLETDILLSTASVDNCVVSTGGGTPCHAGNMDFIVANGKSIYLHLEAEDLATRLKFMKQKRPLIKNVADDDLAAFVGDHLREREAYYSRSEIIIEGDGINPKVVAHLIKSDPVI
ncbi:MAG TPA: shikimate kinase [Bacteroidales bacterium]|nr:shikimate kinase [Bacteroidales bacterium]